MFIRLAKVLQIPVLSVTREASARETIGKPNMQHDRELSREPLQPTL